MIDSFHSRIKNGDEYAIAKAISILENQSDEEAISLRREIYQTPHETYVLGITGSPGAGKSTLISSLVNQWGEQTKIGIISIDPSNKNNGGALLGDRIRMSHLFTNPNVFIRSMSNRGMFGGLNQSILDIIQLFSFAQFDLVIVETIGVGQNETTISEVADTVLVVSAPESGDSIQLLKAGLMEIADIYVINKADLAGAEKMEFLLRESIQIPSNEKWTPKILKVQANAGHHIDDLFKLIQEHKTYLTKNKQLSFKRTKLLQRTANEMLVDRVPKCHIEHIGMAVHSIEEASKLYEILLNSPLGDIVDVSEQSVKARLIQTDNADIELIEPLQPNQGGVGKFLEKKGEGIHHIAIAVEHFDETIATLKEKGIRLIGEPTLGVKGHRIVFIHPKSSNGILIEVCEMVKRRAE